MSIPEQQEQGERSEVQLRSRCGLGPWNGARVALLRCPILRMSHRAKAVTPARDVCQAWPPLNSVKNRRLGEYASTDWLAATNATVNRAAANQR